ncbi:PREDICTED: calcium-binding mitochondrial carrier protein SCaMC-1-A-like isoform X5 [Poecilia mexicana]|uniref:calcium-binding mitochondrial carrier protein SCaMC-1-A-like isoform X5 n=1 Tax=Poecilia mexicana TaxID=48701 RepID=UPI00072E1399|nr:PREDICTED: calcium-binding mitochondrial carrier protein SCaMC-1-A-like isoform X5 [Poecilia mexicana]
MDRFRGLFVKLDQNKDGFISMAELHEEMRKHGIISGDGKVQHIMESYDKDKDGLLDYKEFLSYMMDREKKWKIHFHDLDKNNCGVIDQEDIICLFKELGVVISKPNAKTIIQMMDKDKSMTVDWDEFLHYIILNPVDNIGELVSSWKHSLVFDVGESRAMPIEFPDNVSGFGAWKTFVLSAGLADAVSRTATAPIDRLKTQLQVLGSKAFSQGFQELRGGGLRSMWQGNVVNVLKGTPQSTLQCLIYAQMKVYTQNRSQEPLTVQQRFGLGCVSGAVAHAAFYPLEVLKRLQAQHPLHDPLCRCGVCGSSAFISDSRPASGMLSGLTGIYERNGFRGYYNGMGASFVRAIPCALINYSLTKKFENVFSSMES